MTTTTFTASNSNSTDALFRDWGSKISTALAAIGMVKTSDTGQINWTTVLAPTVVNTQQGYEIWRFNDSLQGTYPIYLRIGFGSGSINNTIPAIWFTIGKGSDGSGNITNVMQAAQQVLQAGSVGPSSGTWYFSSGDGAMLCGAPALQTLSGAAAVVWYFAIERSRDASGAATGSGIWFVRNVSAVCTSTVYNYSDGVAWDTSKIPVATSAVSNNNVSLAVSGVAPVFVPYLYNSLVGTHWHPKSAVVGMRTDVGVITPISVPGEGTFLPLGPVGQNVDSQGGQYSSLCLKWE